MPQLGYNLDNGKLNLSYSRLQILHRCPRMFQITQLNNHGRRTKSAIFAFGHAVAAGVQAMLAGHSYERSCMLALAEYDIPDPWEIDKTGRSISKILLALEKFRIANPLDGWIVPKFRNQHGEVVSGIEFFFQLNIGDDATYQGHVDAILYNPEENKFLVLELKTTGTYHEETYKNSQQTLGYSLVVDWIVDHSNGLLNIADPEQAKASNRVLYFVFDIGAEVWQPLPLLQMALAKADFIQSLLLDYQHIKAMQEVDMFPKNGDSCRNFNRPCEWYNLCDQQSLTKEKAIMSAESAFCIEEPALIFDVAAVLEQQLAKVSSDVYQTADPIAIPNIQIERDAGDFSL